MADKQNPFVIAQLEEALEERQNPDRRKLKEGEKRPAEQERRRGARRGSPQSAN